MFCGPCTCNMGDRKYTYEFRRSCVEHRFGSPNEGDDAEKAFDYIRRCLQLCDKDASVIAETPLREDLGVQAGQSIGQGIETLTDALTEQYQNAKGNYYN